MVRRQRVHVRRVEVEEVVSDDRISFIFDLTNESLIPLQTIGNSVVTSGNAIDSAGLLLLRLSDNEVVVFSRSCTHSGASVNSFQNGISLCNSHGSEFNTLGEVVTGPATRPLKKYESTLDGTTLADGFTIADTLEFDVLTDAFIFAMLVP